MIGLVRAYVRIPIVTRMLAGFCIGGLAGTGLWIVTSRTGSPVTEVVMPWIAPLGTVFINMLKMVVIPVVFLSLIIGASSLPLRQFGRVGSRVIGWYLLTSVLAAAIGVGLAVVLNPGSGTSAGEWERFAAALNSQAQDLATHGIPAMSTTFTDVLLNLFRNPFESLATGNFLPLIMAALLFGVACRIVIDSSSQVPAEDESGDHPPSAVTVEHLLDLVGAAQRVVFRIVDWVLEYGPVGVFALSLVNFGLYGPAIVGPYVTIVAGVIGGVTVMMVVVYPLLMILLAKRNPVIFYRRARGPLITAFTTRSSAATLPVTLRTANEQLGVPTRISSFSLPLGATVNMDGVCIHLPFFAVLAANLFALSLTPAALIALVLVTVLASIGAGGVPGGSLMLLFLVMGSMGLDAHQTAIIVALALGVNPILDMFETMNNVADDLVCTYVVASREGVVSEGETSVTGHTPT